MVPLPSLLSRVWNLVSVSFNDIVEIDLRLRGRSEETQTEGRVIGAVSICEFYRAVREAFDASLNTTFPG